MSAGFPDRLPPVERVIADNAGSDAFESRIRQAAACDVMTRAVELLMGPRYYRSEWQPGEQPRRQAYAACVGDRMPEPGTSNADRRAIVNGYSKLKFDPRFVAEVRKRYISAQDLAQLEKQEAEWNAALGKQQASARAGMAGFEGSQQANLERAQQIKSLLFKVLAASVAALFLGGWGILRGLRPARFDAQARPATLSVAGRSFAFHDAGGIVADLSSERHVTHYPGTNSYDQHGRLIGSTSGYSVANTDQTIFIIDADAKERALQFRDWNIVARPGNAVASVWAIPRGKASGPYLAFRNITLDTSLTAFGVLERMFRVHPIWLLLFTLGLLPAVFALAMAGTGGHSVFTPAIVAVAVAVVAVLAIRRTTKARSRAFGRNHLTALLDRAGQDARAAADRMLAPLRPA